MGPTQPPIQCVMRVKRLEPAVDHAIRPFAEVKNEWSYASTVPKFHGFGQGPPYRLPLCFALKEYHGVTSSLNIMESRSWEFEASLLLGFCCAPFRYVRLKFRDTAVVLMRQTPIIQSGREFPQKSLIFSKSVLGCTQTWTGAEGFCRVAKLKVHLQKQLHSPGAQLIAWRHNFDGATWLFNSFRSQLGTPMWWPNNSGYETGCEAWYRVLARIALLPRTGCTEISLIPENTKPKHMMAVGLL